MPEIGEEPEGGKTQAFFSIEEEPAAEEEEKAPEPAAEDDEEEAPVVLPGVFDELDDVFTGMEEEPEPLDKPAVPAKAHAGSKGQGELSFEGGPRGKFEGASPSLFEGEDLDVPAFLRKKR